MVTNIDILNALRAGSTQQYVDRIPLATRTNIAEVGNAILEYTPTKNEFLENLINKIGLTLIVKAEGDNKFARFTKTLEYGDTVEEIFASIIKAQNFDADDDNPFAKEKPTVDTIFHKIDREIFYPLTIEDKMLRRAFRSETGLSELVNTLISNLYESKEYDDFLMTKQLLAEYDGYKHVEVSDVVDGDSAKQLLFAIKQASSALEYRSKEFNKLGVNTRTPKERQLLVIRADAMNYIDLEYLAGIYNVDRAKIHTKVIEVDNFNTAEDIVAVLIDENIFRIYQNLLTMESQRNAKGLYTNYFLHSWSLYSLSKFMNAVKFSTDEEPEEPIEQE